MKRVVWAILVIAASAIFTIGQINKDYDTPVKIISKPRAGYPSQEKGTICVQGTVTLRVQFLDSGEIGKISVVSGLPYGLSDCAIEAAKRINFQPAMKDGKPVTVTKTITYTFILY